MEGRRWLPAVEEQWREQGWPSVPRGSLGRELGKKIQKGGMTLVKGEAMLGVVNSSPARTFRKRVSVDCSGLKAINSSLWILYFQSLEGFSTGVFHLLQFSLQHERIGFRFHLEYSLKNSLKCGQVSISNNLSVISMKKWWLKFAFR